MITKNLYLLVGKSGSGKTVLGDKLCEVFHGTKAVKSVTTRPKRNGPNTDYYFLTDEEYDNANLVQHAQFNGYRYGATLEEVDQSSWFTMCPNAIPEFQNVYRNRPIIAIYLDTTDDTRRNRMINRGDAIESIESRIRHDQTSFGEIPNSIPTIKINANRDFKTVLNDVTYVIETLEGLFG